MKHKWQQNQSYGVTGSGRPYGVDESWTCCKCGLTKGRGPESTHTGKRVIRWSYQHRDGYFLDYIPSCQ
jgi:hypothetical protein